MAQENRYIILGSGIAGMAAAEAIREKDPEATIRMISAEEELCFNRPMLIRDFALDGSGAVLFEQQQSWPAQYGVEVLLGTKAVSIDRAAKRVRLETESSQTEEAATVPYDKLIYALGAEVTIPPISGAERENVHVVRTREDMRGIRAAMRGAKHAVVIGGGMLGLEDAWALREEKLEVAIIERQQRVAFGQIDQSAGNLMKKRIERMGVPVYVNAQVTEIGDGYVTFLQPAQDTSMSRTSGMTGCSGCATAAVDIATGSEGCPAAADTDAELVTIPADLVILSTGVTPNSALGAKAGLATVKQPPQWIAVDEFCQTSDPNIFAAGDCAAMKPCRPAIRPFLQPAMWRRCTGEMTPSGTRPGRWAAWREPMRQQWLNRAIKQQWRMSRRG